MNYKQLYLKHIKKTFWEPVFCEVCWALCDDIHHIIYRSQWGKDEIGNLIGLCRNCHNMAHFKKEPYLKKEELLKIVKKRIDYFKK